MTTKYGARVSLLDDKTAIVKQTIKREGSAQNDPYVIDEHKEAMVSLDDDQAIADAVRGALAGTLKK